MNLQVDVIVDDEATRVQALGAIDTSSTTQFAAALSEACAQPKPVLVDLRGVTFMDSSGLTTLVAAHRLSEASGGAFAVLAPPAQIARLFDITSVDDVLTIVTD